MPSVASADVIPLLTCAPGWRSTNAGHSAYCAPTPCTSDADCGGGTCTEVARCMRTRPMDVGDAPPSDPPATYQEPLEALCSAEGSCGIGTDCVHERECTAPPAASSGSCAIGSRSAAPLGGLASLALAGLLLGRRRR